MNSAGQLGARSWGGRPAAIYAGARVRFKSAAALSQELLAAADEHCLPRHLRSWRSADLVIVDEVGYLPLGPTALLDRLTHYSHVLSEGESYRFRESAGDFTKPRRKTRNTARW